MCFAQHNTADSRMTIKALPTNRKPAGSSRREGHSWPFLLLGPPLMAGTTSEKHHVRQPRSRGFESRLQALLAGISSAKATEPEPGKLGSKLNFIRSVTPR